MEMQALMLALKAVVVVAAVGALLRVWFGIGVEC